MKIIEKKKSLIKLERKSCAYLLLFLRVFFSSSFSTNNFIKNISVSIFKLNIYVKTKCFFSVIFSVCIYTANFTVVISPIFSQFSWFGLCYWAELNLNHSNHVTLINFSISSSFVRQFISRRRADNLSLIWNDENLTMKNNNDDGNLWINALQSFISIMSSLSKRTFSHTFSSD